MRIPMIGAFTEFLQKTEARLNRVQSKVALDAQFKSVKKSTISAP